MDLRRGEWPPISTGLPDKRKSVRTIGGADEESTTVSGKKDAPPLNPPKNISPLGLWKHAPQPVKFGPGSPSAVEKLENAFFSELNRATPLFVLIQRSPPSSRMQPTAFPGRPSFCVKAANLPVRGSNLFSPFWVPTHIVPKRSKCTEFTRLSLSVPGRFLLCS